MPPFSNLLEFARASESTAREGDWKRDSGKKSAVNLYVDSCVACSAKHQLHKCRDFYSMFHNWKMAIVKKNALLHKLFEARPFSLKLPR